MFYTILFILVLFSTFVICHVFFRVFVLFVYFFLHFSWLIPIFTSLPKTVVGLNPNRSEKYHNIAYQ